MFDQILVPVDGSLLAENILPHAAAMAKVYGSEITLISVLDPRVGSDSAQPVIPWEWQIRQAEVKAYLNDLSSRLEISGLKVQTIWLEGKAADRVLDHSSSTGMQLILLSSHGRGGLSDWNSSSVATKIIQQASTSLMIIRSYTSQEQTPPDTFYRRILAPVDGSQRAEYGLSAAAHLAREQGAELLIAHVVKPPELIRRTPLSVEDRNFITQLVESNRTDASRYLNDLKGSLDCKVKTILLTGESVPDALHHLAEQEGVDLVILTAHGFGGNPHLPFGSIALNFLTYGTTALLIVQDFARDLLCEAKGDPNSSGLLRQLSDITDEARQVYGESIA